MIQGSEIDLIDEIVLFDKDFIIKNAIKEKRKIVSGVYFLTSSKDVIYIGSSTDVYRRIESHKKNRRMPFNGFLIHPIYSLRKDTDSKKALYELEKRYIRTYKPKYNFRDNPDYENGQKEVFRTFLNEFKNLYEVARMCDDSVCANNVSRVLNKDPSISNEIIKKVEDAIMSRYKINPRSFLKKSKVLGKEWKLKDV